MTIPDGSLRVGSTVILVTPGNPYLHGQVAVVTEIIEWGAHVKTKAASTGKYRALFEEMEIIQHSLTHLDQVGEYIGDVCTTCGGIRLRRAGACVVCEDCGTSGGCS